MTITYELGKSLYVNITNRCTNNCSFCIRNTPSGIGSGIDLWLDREPTIKEIIDDIRLRNLSKYKEIVFCGYGEPMIRLNALIEVCRDIKKISDIPIRINTNGQANLIFDKDITPMLSGLIDCVSISLNTKNAKEYQKVCKSTFGERAYEGMLDFAVKCKKYVPIVILTVVDVIGKEDIKECEKIAQNLDIQFRVRKYTE